MASHTQRIGLFTAENIAAMLQAIPDSNGTYADTAGKAQEHGAILSPYTNPVGRTEAAPTSEPAGTTRPTRGSPNNTTN